MINFDSPNIRQHDKCDYLGNIPLVKRIPSERIFFHHPKYQYKTYNNIPRVRMKETTKWKITRYEIDKNQFGYIFEEDLPFKLPPL